MNGYVKIYRKLVNWEWYRDSQMVHLFIHLVLTANRDKRTWRGIDLNRGQTVTGRKKLTDETGISEQSIRTCLERLVLTGEITISPTNKFSLITVCNYDDYQDVINDRQPTINQQSTNKTPTIQPTKNATKVIDDQLNINVEIGQSTSKSTNKFPQINHKQEEQEEEKRVAHIHKFKIPTIEMVTAYCAERRNKIDPELFVDHYTTNGWTQGRGKPIRDWRACVRTWEKRDNSFNHTKTTNNVQRKIQPVGIR